MKYVFLKHPSAYLPRIVLGFAPQSHADLAAPAIAEGYTPVTAGFLRVLPSGHFETFGDSVSLRLASHPDDARLITSLHRATLPPSSAAGHPAAFALGKQSDSRERPANFSAHSTLGSLAMPTKPNRIKAPCLGSRLAFETAVDELARVEVDLRKAEARRDARLQATRDEFEPAVQALQEEKEGLALAVEKFAEEHRGELFPGKLKSAETPLAFFGFRLGQPTLKLLSRAWTWERVMQALLARDWVQYIRTKQEPDKEALKARLEPEQLAAVGCRIDQAETFFVEPKDQASAVTA